MGDPSIVKRMKNIHELCTQYYKDIVVRFKNKSIPKVKQSRRFSPYMNESINQEEYTRTRLDKVPSTKSQSVQSIKEMECHSISKIPAITQIGSITQTIKESHKRFTHKLPNKTVETERLIARMKKIEQFRERREGISHRFLPVKESGYLVEIIKQRLQTSSNLQRGYVPSLLPPLITSK